MRYTESVGAANYNSNAAMPQAHVEIQENEKR